MTASSAKRRKKRAQTCDLEIERHPIPTWGRHGNLEKKDGGNGADHYLMPSGVPRSDDSSLGGRRTSMYTFKVQREALLRAG